VGEQQASEAIVAAAGGSGQDAPGEPLASEAGTAAAAATKDLACSMLGEEAPRQCAEVAVQDEGPADGALVGGDEALRAEFETRAPAGNGKALTEACCLIIGCLRRWAIVRKQAEALAASDVTGASSEVGAADKVPPAVDDPRAALQRRGDSADKAAAAAAAKGSAHGAVGEQQASEAIVAAAGGSGQDAPGEPLASEAGAAAAAATKDLACSMLGGEAPWKRVDVAAQDEGPADGVLVGGGEARWKKTLGSRQQRRQRLQLRLERRKTLRARLLGSEHRTRRLRLGTTGAANGRLGGQGGGGKRLGARRVMRAAGVGSQRSSGRCCP
jgi:hypothetical protein